jgi:hypothetical protein
LRGGALPIFAWALLLALLAAGNWVWAGDKVQIAEWGFAVLVILAAAIALTLASRGSATRRGPPEPDPVRRAVAVPDISFGAALAALGAAAAVFGITFGHFSIYFGCGLFVIGLGRVGLELRSQRRSLERFRTRPQPEDVVEREPPR